MGVVVDAPYRFDVWMGVVVSLDSGVDLGLVCRRIDDVQYLVLSAAFFAQGLLESAITLFEGVVTEAAVGNRHRSAVRHHFHHGVRPFSAIVSEVLPDEWE